MSTTSKGTESGGRHVRKGETVSRARYDALVDRIEDLEDRIEMAGIERDAATREGEPSPDALPDELMGRLLNGDHPVDVWRAHRGYTLVRLETLSGVPASYISEIANDKKPGSADALSRLAKALDISLEDLTAWDGDSELPEATPLRPIFSQDPTYNPITDRVRFPAGVKKDAVMIVVSREAFERLAAKNNLDGASAEKVVEKKREYLCKIASRKYAAHDFDDGNILIGPGDLD
jgi:transcriptional regulator with XRE-family HTH domain